MHKLLLVEDDVNLASTIADYLSKQGFMIKIANNGNLGMSLALQDHFVVIILDVMLPGMNGFDICKNLRKEGIQTPILFLTSKTHVSEIVNGLKLGADAYVTKPFQFIELQVRIEALIKRPPQTQQRQVKIGGEINIDYDKLEVTRNGKAISLRHKEFAILKLLLEMHGRVLSREFILDHTGDSNAYAATVDVHVSRLRKALGNIAGKKVIETIHGSGYRISLSVE